MQLDMTVETETWLREGKRLSAGTYSLLDI